MYHTDPDATTELIQRMRLARMGDYTKWKKLVRKINNHQMFTEEEMSYFTMYARMYKKSKTTARSRILHVRLSEEDTKPKCQSCRRRSEFYCNQNDAYFCSIHIVGHDENER